MQVSELMTPDPITLMVDDSFDLAEKFMEFAHIRHLPVVEGERVIGLVTHRDLLRASIELFANSRMRPQPGEPIATQRAQVAPREERERKQIVLVSEIMRSGVHTVLPDADVREAITTMIDHKYGCLPVCDGEGHLRGIITEADFLKFTKRLLDEVDVA